MMEEFQVEVVERARAAWHKEGIIEDVDCSVHCPNRGIRQVVRQGQGEGTSTRLVSGITE